MSKPIDNATLSSIVYDIYRQKHGIPSIEELAIKYKVSPNSLRVWLQGAQTGDLYHMFKVPYKQTSKSDIILLHSKLLNKRDKPETNDSNITKWKTDISGIRKDVVETSLRHK